MYRISSFLILSLSAVSAMGAGTVTSPDGKLVVTVDTDAQGKPAYSVAYDGKDFLLPSSLGLVSNVGDFSKGLALSGMSDAVAVSDSYSLPGIKKSHVDYKATERWFTFSKDSSPVFEVQFRVADNDVAFRYRMLPQGETRSAVILDEATGFTLPDGTVSFMAPQSKPMGGFARTSPSYETPYGVDEPIGRNGWGEGYTFPCLFKNPEGGWTLISETGVDGSYCGGRLLWDDKAGCYTVGFPQQGEMNGLNSVTPGIPLPGFTPWRLVTVGNSLSPVVETTAPFDVVTPKYEPSRQYTYGKGTWSWIIGMDGATNYDVQKQYIDFSADMGYNSVLVDALWDTQIGYDRIAELSRYAASKGVGLYLWYNSNGYWNDAPQGPRGKMDNAIARRKEMKWMRDNGIRGIKVDFFGGDKQPMMQLYEDILADANDFGLMVIFHGCTLPRGWERMYPNYAASEAVLASENLHFSQGSCDAEAFNATIHPFVRNTVGSMDFGGSALNKYYNAANAPGGSRRVTSDVYALATAVLFQSPVQHFALAPGNMTDAPAWAIDFMKEVPTLWDETVYIDGYPGKYAILGRRHGDTWYIAGVNGLKEPVAVEISLPMFASGQKVVMYSDDKNLQGAVKEVKIDKKQRLKVTMPCNGGVLIKGIKL